MKTAAGVETFAAVLYAFEEPASLRRTGNAYASTFAAGITGCPFSYAA